MKRTVETDVLRYVGTGVIIFLIFILQYSGLAPLTLFGMTAMLVVPSVLFCAMYMSEFAGAMFGLVFGVCLDAVSMHTVCFNAVFLLGVGCFASALSKHLFHRNMFSALLMSAAVNLAYFLLKWLIFTAFSVQGAVVLLVGHSLPSAVYTTVISYPLYFLFNKLLSTKRAEVKRV